MLANQKLNDPDGYQVALFPLEGVYVTQADYETFSHASWYYATDYAGYNSAGQRVLRCACYAPVDIKCIWVNRQECCAVWESLNQVHLANDTINYLGILVYHDNDIANGLITPGTIKRQGEQFNRTGTGGNVTGDHMHLETGYGRYTTSTSGGQGSPEYKYHFTDYTNVKRLHNYDALYINDTRIVHNASGYNWVEYEGGVVPPGPGEEKHKFPWVLYARKLRTNIR